GAGSGTCTRAQPCNSFALGLAQVSGQRSIIKAVPGTYSGPVTVDGKTVLIYADGATAQGVVTVTNSADATIEGLTVTGVSGTSIAVTCDGSGSTIRLRRSTVINNMGGGGISITDCQYSLINNVIAVNGNGSSTFGGVRLIGGGTLHDFLFNTVAGNVSK